MTLCDHKNFELVLVLTGMKISKKQDRTLTTVFNKLSDNVFFDFRFRIFFTSGQTFQPITSGKSEIGQRFFDMLLVAI